MNQFFSFKRWGLLTLRHWAAHRKFFMYGCLSLLGAMAIAAGFWLQTNTYYMESDLYIIFTFGIFIAGAIFSSLSFKMLHHKEQGIAYLSLPASRFEKLLTAVFYHIILFTVVYILCFALIRAATLSIIETRLHNGLGNYRFSSIADRPVFDHGLDEFLIYFYFSVQTLFMAGSIYFKRFQFLLTLIVGVLIAIFGIYYLQELGHAFMPNGYYWNINGASIYMDGDMQRFGIQGVLGFVINWLARVGWIIGFLWVSWFRLAEKQI